MKYLMIITVSMMFLSTACKSQKENTEINKSETEVRNQNPQKPGGKKGPRDINEVFKMDTNQDNMISKSEAMGRLLERFSTIDTNADGMISREEFESAPKPQKRKGSRPEK